MFIVYSCLILSPFNFGFGKRLWVVTRYPKFEYPFRWYGMRHWWTQKTEETKIKLNHLLSSVLEFQFIKFRHGTSIEWSWSLFIFISPIFFVVVCVCQRYGDYHLLIRLFDSCAISEWLFINALNRLSRIKSEFDRLESKRNEYVKMK